VKSDTDTDNGDGGDDPEDEEQKVVTKQYIFIRSKNKRMY